MGWDETPPPEWQEIAEALSVRLSEVEKERDALRAELARGAARVDSCFPHTESVRTVGHDLRTEEVPRCVTGLAWR